MASQKQLKKDWNFKMKAKSCASCKFCQEADVDSKDIVCKKNGIIIQNEVTGIGNETLLFICDGYEQSSKRLW